MPFLIMFLQTQAVRALIIAVLRQLAKHTDNALDDQAVDVIEGLANTNPGK